MIADEVIVELKAKLDKYNADVLRASQNFEKGMDTIAKSSLRAEAQALRSSTAIQKAFAGIGAVFGISELIRYADTWSDLSSRVGNAAGSMEMAEPVMAKLAEIARRTYSDMGQTAEAYILNASTLRELGYNTQDVINYTESLNNALVVSGAKGEVAASVMDALSKAMALGKLQGDNLNTVISRGGRVAQALADSMGVSTLQLRKLGKEGKITRTELFGITKEMEKLRKEADEMPATISDAFQLMRNAILLWVGGMDQASQSSAKVAEAIIFVADNFGTLADAALNLSTVLAGALAGKALVSVITMSGTVVTSITGLVAAFRAGTIAATTFYAALGPIAMTIGAVSAAVYLLSTRQSDAARSNEKFEAAIRLNETALNDAKDASGKYTQALRDQIAMQVEAARTAYDLATATFESSVRMATSFAKMTGFRFAPLDYNVERKEEEVAAALEVLDKLEQQLKRIDETGVSKTTPPPGDGTKSGSKKKTADDRFDNLLQGIRDRTEAMRIEAEVTGLVYQEQEKRRMALELEQEALKIVREEARKKGDQDWQNAKLSPEQIAKINEMSEAYAQQAEALRLIEEAQGRAESAANEFYDSFKSGMIGALKGAESFSDALSKILEKLAEMVLNSAFDSLFSGATGSGGWLTGIFKGLGFSSGGYTGPGPKNKPAGIVHAGEVVWSQDDIRKAGGVAAVEAMRKGVGGMAVPAAIQVPTMPRLANMGGGGGTINAPVNINIDATGADREGLMRVEQQVAKLRQEVPSMVISNVRKAQKSNVKLG